MPIGTSDGDFFDDSYHHEVSMNLDPTGPFANGPGGFDDGPTMDQQFRDSFAGNALERPTVGSLKGLQNEFERNLQSNNGDDFIDEMKDRTIKTGDKLLQSPYERAQAGMDLNPQERSLYERHLGNLSSKGGVDNPDGSRSTLYVGTYGVDDKTYVLPRVRDGKILSADDAFNAAKKEGLDKYPSYDSQDKAEKRYQDMHQYMEEDTKAFLKSRDPFKTKVEGKNQDRVPQNAPFPSIIEEGTKEYASKIADKYGKGSDLNGPYHVVPSDKDVSDEEWNSSWGSLVPFGYNFKSKKVDPDLKSTDDMLKTLPDTHEMFRWEKGRETRDPMYMIRKKKQEPPKLEDLIS